MIVLIIFCALNMVNTFANIENTGEITKLEQVTEAVEVNIKKSYTTQPIKLYTDLSKEDLFNVSNIKKSMLNPIFEPDNDQNHDANEQLEAVEVNMKKSYTTQPIKLYTELSKEDFFNVSNIKKNMQSPILEPDNDQNHNANKQPELSSSKMHYTTDPSIANNHNLYRIPEWKEHNESVPELPEATFDLTSPNERLASMNITNNWTTCEQFLNNTPPLDINKLIDVDWRIFYFWVQGDLQDTYNVRFHRPTFTLIDRFKREVQEYHDNIKPPVNWTNAELWMETAIDLSAMFLKTDKPGMYRFLPTIIFYTDNVEYLEYAFKIVEPGYLGIVNCFYKTGFSLAPVNNMPSADKALAAASTLGFWNSLGVSFADLKPAINIPVENMNTDDAYDDEEMDIEHDSDIMNIF